jgi:DNA-binding transcriptional ArsR family regulator
VVHKRLLVKRSDQQTAVALRALGEPRRVEILQLLRKGPLAVGEIAARVDVTQQAVSQHLAVLGQAGLVEARREGTRSVYAVRPDGFAPVEEFVRSFWTPRLRALKDDIEGKK